VQRFKPSPAMIVAIVATVLALSGGAYAAGTMISGSQIKNGTIAAAKLSASAKKQLKGQKGATGSTGATGAQGPAGPKGDTGATGLTGPKGERGIPGTAAAQGEEGPEGPMGEEGPEGPAGPTEHNYGVAALFSNGTKVATLWTPTIPMDDNNAALASGSTVITSCPVGGCTLTVRGVVRSDTSTFGGQAGVGLVVTAANGTLVTAGQTPASAEPGFPGVRVVPVNTVGLGSGDPEAATGTAIPVEGLTTLPEGGPYIVQGTVEFFDFS
jgi:Collagen triple helix repeat (20 copies)